MLSVVAWNVGWALSYPQYLALVRRSDISHRLYTASPAIVSLASFAGAASGGLLIERANFGVAIAASASFLMAALGLSGGAELILRHRQPLTST
jgi:predicted MFS family arabinose efflux permease